MNLLTSAASLDASIMFVTKQWAQMRSKDPNTKVGACVYDHATGGLFLGYNGFPPGFPDTEENWQRPQKYRYVVHAETNAIRKALQAKVDMTRTTLYITHLPCMRCTIDNILSNNIPEVVATRAPTGLVDPEVVLLLGNRLRYLEA